MASVAKVHMDGLDQILKMKEDSNNNQVNILVQRSIILYILTHSRLE